MTNERFFWIFQNCTMTNSMRKCWDWRRDSFSSRRRLQADEKLRRTIFAESLDSRSLRRTRIVRSLDLLLLLLLLLLLPPARGSSRV